MVDSLCSVIDDDKLYYAKLAASSPRVNPLLLKADSVAMSGSASPPHFDDETGSDKLTFSSLIHSNKSSDIGSNTEVELQKLGPIDDDTAHSFEMDSVDFSGNTRVKKPKLSTWSDVASMARAADCNLRDRRLAAMILRESRTALSISKIEFESIGKWRQMLYSAVHSITFEAVVAMLITANVVCLSLPRTPTLSMAEDIFVFIFFGELILRIIAVGFVSFFTKSSLLALGDAVLIMVSFASFWLYTARGSTDEYLDGLGGIMAFRVIRILAFIRILPLRFLESFNRTVLLIS